jgi:hypothetical protein
MSTSDVTDSVNQKNLTGQGSGNVAISDEGAHEMKQEAIFGTVQEKLKEITGDFKEKKGVFSLDFVIAERKAFLCRQKLLYTARFRVDDDAREVTFTERLTERKSGFGAGGADDIGPGVGWKKSSFAAGTGGLEGVVDQQSSLFGKKYNYTFDYKRVRSAVKEAAETENYAFNYKIWGKV